MKRKKGDTNKKKRKKKKADTPIGPPWRKGIFSPEPAVIHQPSYIEVDSSNWTTDDYIAQYIDDNLLSMMVDKSNQTFLLRTGKILNLSLSEFKVWLGINYVMAALQLPKIRMYWEKKWRVPLVADAMSRDRFFLIRANVKVVFDNEVDPDQRKADRLWKIRPLIDRVLQGCLKQYKQQELSLDEMMIPFTGVCPLKQYIPTKPNPEGLKAYVLANPNGVVCDFAIHQGKATFPVELSEKFWQCECAILLLTRSLVPGHIIYIDRFFNTVRLADELYERGFRVTGTLMKSRVPENTDLPDDKTFKKNEERGTSVVSVREDGRVAVTKWLDNNSVVMLSTNESAEPLCNVKRWSKTEKRYKIVTQPRVINSYNRNMGGVDLTDRMLSYCPSRARTSKWTIRTILHFFDLSLTNSWLQYRETQKTLGTPSKGIPQFRTFKLNYGQSLIEMNDKMAKRQQEANEESDEEVVRNLPTPDRRVTEGPSVERRCQGAVHLPEATKGLQKRCAAKACKKKSTIYCIKCNVYLCLVAGRNCFKIYHTK